MEIGSKFIKHINSKNISILLKNNTYLKYGVLGICIIIIILALLWLITNLNKRKNNCKKLNNLYKDFPRIKNVNVNNENYKYNLRDYYIKTAYNACSGGKFKNDFVDKCALISCIRQGNRCLDFEVYSVDNEPVVATSSVSDFRIKETYNDLPFSEVLETINEYAYSGSTCPNPNDPLIIHLRIMSNNMVIYDKMYEQIQKIFNNKLLGPEYSYEYQGKNLGTVPLSTLIGKIIIAADKSNPVFESTKLNEFVNIASNSIFMKASRYTQDIKYAPDVNEEIEYNKKNITLCLPDLMENDVNPSPALAFKYGCQMVAMCNQNYDSNMQYYDDFFDNVGSAFVLKPKELRFIPTTIEVPKPPPEKYSYKERKVSTDYYKMTI